MQCPSCGRENHGGRRFCAECGADLTLACLSCGAKNEPGARFCGSCGRRLANGARAATDPRSYTPKHLAEKILSSRSALEGERKQVTVLFADMVDSMLLAEKIDAEEWHRILDRFFQILAEGVHRFEGTINQFTGDGVMALFGAPVAHEDHARRACHAALALMAELGAYASTLKRRGLEFSVRMGLNSGEVVVGKIGDDLRMDYTAQGHSVGLAARMQQLAAPRTVYLTEHTARLIEGFFVVSDRGTPAMKGVSAPLRIFELTGFGPLKTRLDASGSRGFSRLVGREEDLAWLESLLGRAVEANGQIVGIVGDAGVGKSRLCLEFVNRCRTRGIAVYEAHCPAHGSTVPLLPIRDLVRTALGLEEGESAQAARRKISDRLLLLDPGFDEAVPLILDLLGVADEGASGAPLATAERLADFMRRLVRLRGAEPVVWLLDDAHWIDGASEEVVREVGRAVSGTRALLLANFRPDYQPPWSGGSHIHRLSLSPLGEAASRELVHELCGPDPSLGDLSDLILERTGGNPFFIEEIVQSLAASEILAGRRGAYRLSAPIDTLGLPTTVQSLLAARIDRLGEQAKHVLQTAAVIGREFDAPLLSEICELGADDLAAGLNVLQEAELVYLAAPDPRPQYAFKHPLTREVAYSSQLVERRARLHAAVAVALEKLRADRLGEFASLIAHHWLVSGRRYEAARWQRRAALKVSNIKVKARRPTRS